MSCSAHLHLDQRGILSKSRNKVHLVSFYVLRRQTFKTFQLDYSLEKSKDSCIEEIIFQSLGVPIIVSHSDIEPLWNINDILSAGIRTFSVIDQKVYGYRYDMNNFPKMIEYNEIIGKEISLFVL